MVVQGVNVESVWRVWYYSTDGWARDDMIIAREEELVWLMTGEAFPGEETGSWRTWGGGLDVLYLSA